MFKDRLSLFVLGITVSAGQWACSAQTDDEDSNSRQQPGVSVPIGPQGPDGVPKPGEGNGGAVTITKDIYDRVVSNSCNLEVNEPETLPSKIEMVVDVSSSMTETAPGSTRNKWLETRDAIIDAFVGTSGGGLSNTTAVGLLFYPNIDTSPKTSPSDLATCVRTDAMIPMQTLGDNAANSQRSMLRDALTRIQLGPRGTPTFDALKYGTETGLLQGGQAFDGESYVVLITDGMPTLAPNCSNPNGNISDVDPQPIVDLIDEQYRQNGVKTYLIGSPGSEKGRAWMSRAAVLGHTAAPGCSEAGPNWCHMDLTTNPDFGQALRDGLGVIAGEVVSCSYNVYAKSVDESQTVDPMLTTVIARFGDGSYELVNRDDTPGDCKSGWYLDGEKKRVVMCGETCGKIQSDPLAGVTVSYGCPISLTEQLL